MKHLNFKMILSGLALVYFWGCNQLDDGSYTTPISLYEKVSGDWSLTSLKMVDEIAKSNGIEPDEQNLHQYFNYEQFGLQLHTDTQFKPTTYTVLGEVPPLIAPEGYWELSSAFQPTNSDPVRVKLYADKQRTQLLDELLLTSVPGASGNMQIQLVRSSDGAAYVSYVFDLTQANNQQ